MNCKKCGAPLNPGDVFCKVCGTPVDNVVQPAVAAPGAINDFQTAPNFNTQPQPATMQSAPQPQAQPVGGFTSMPASNQPLPPAKSSKGLIIGLVVGGVLIVGLIVIGIIVAIVIAGGSKTETPVVTPTSKPVGQKVTYKNFVFTVPETLKYQISSSPEGLVISDKTISWYSIIREENISIDKINMMNITPALQKAYPGYTISNLTSKVINNKRFYVFDFSKADGGRIGIISQGGSQHIFQTEIEDYGAKNHSLVDKFVAPVLASAEAASSTNSIKIDISSSATTPIELVDLE